MFDVDKLYIMLPEFNIRKNYDLKAAWEDFYNNPNNADILDEINKNLELGLEDYKEQHPDDTDLDIDEYFEFLQGLGVKKYQLSEKAKDRFSKWFKNRKSNYLKNTTISKIKYDYDKSVKDQSLKARNNALIDLMWGILTNPDTASKILNPGGFDKQKIAARIVTILDYMSEQELTKEGYTIEKLLSMSYNGNSLEALDKLAEKYKKRLDPLSPRTQVVLHQQNMTGAKMIGIYANHNANHALIQHTELSIDDKNGSFNFGGVKRTSLHEMKNEKGDFISRNNANFLAASVDNVKDNTLHATNQNTFTGDATMLLSRLGYTPTEIAILMKQPIVMEITRSYFKAPKNERFNSNNIIDDIIRKTAKYAGMYENITWGNVKKNLFNLKDLMRDIMLYKDIAIIPKNDRIEFYRRQVAIGLLFKRIMNTADALGTLTQATRSDTPGGAAGPTIADTLNKIEKVNSLLENVYTNNKFPLINADVITDSIGYSGDIDSLRKRLLDSKLPFLQAFYTLGLQQTTRMMGKYFPQYSQSFMEVLDGVYDDEGILMYPGLRQMTKTGKLNVKTINSIFNDLFAYIMSRTEFFGTGKNKYGKEVSITEKRRDFINHFPNYFEKLISENEDIADLELIRRLRKVKSNDKNPVNVLVFNNVGQLTPILRERFSNDWASLLYMNNPKAQELALNLFLYSYYRNGFAFGPSTFIHLAPILLREAVPEYISTLRGLIGSNDDYHYFVDQYVYNHLDNRQLVPEISDTAITEFTDENGSIKDDVTFIIDTASTKGDRAAIKSEMKDEEGNIIYEFMDFIGKKINNKWCYYKLVESEENTAIYTRIEPLGYKNNFIEYEYGKEAEEIQSVIDRNKKDYDPLAEFAAEHEDKGLSEEDMKSMHSYINDYSEEELASFANEVAFETVYGESPTPILEDSNNITDITPNESYRDANNDKICGGSIVKAIL